MDKKLRLYVNPAWKRWGLHTPLLFPFWGNITDEKVSLFAKQMFDAHPFDTTLYDVTNDISQADMVLSPYRHNWLRVYDKALLDDIVASSKKANVPLLLDGIGDVEFPVNIDNCYVLRIGGYKFLPEKGRIQLPPAADDLLERVRGGELQVRQKTSGIPTVGFAGWAKLTAVQTLRTVIKEIPIRLRGVFDSKYRACIKGVLWRRRAIDILRRSPLVRLNLKARPSFSGSAKTASGDMAQLREDLAQTILESDYALDVRGDANDSTRLFEILSLGRIPVMVNTERNLPFSDVLNYEDFCLIVDFRNIKRLPEIISTFHTSVSPEQYEAMQRKAREAFVNYFRIDAQMTQIVRLLDLKIK